MRTAPQAKQVRGLQARKKINQSEHSYDEMVHSLWKRVNAIYLLAKGEQLPPVNVLMAAQCSEDHARLLNELTSILTLDAYREIRLCPDIEERERKAAGLLHKINVTVRESLLPRRPVKGRKGRNFERDSQIYLLRESGWSFGDIGVKMGIPYKVAQAAFNRHSKKVASAKKLGRRLAELLDRLESAMNEAKAASSSGTK